MTPNAEDQENFDVENDEVDDVTIFALTLDEKKLETSGFANDFKDLPLQHVNLFLPFFIEDLNVKDVDFFSECLNQQLLDDFKIALNIANKDAKTGCLFNFFAIALKNLKFAKSFANWIQKFGKNEAMKNAFWMDMVDRSAFAVYKYHILGIGNPDNRGDNVDRIASILYVEHIIAFLKMDGDSDYCQLSDEIAAMFAYQTQLARWKARNFFLIRFICLKAEKKLPKFWFNQFLLALADHPRTRSLAGRLEPNYKLINDKYCAYLQSLNVPIMMNDELVDEDYVPTEFRKQKEFGDHPQDVDRIRVDNYHLYGYQEELVGKAKQGVNTIICAPTGSGKTIVAIDIIVNHLRNNCFSSKPARVVMFVPTIPLVEQQYSRIKEKIGREWYITKLSGAENLLKKDENGEFIDDQTNRILVGDVCVMTPQIFVNMLLTPIKKHKIYIQDFTLMVFDECHHCNERHPYNIVMENVWKQREKPQIIGLTASVGTGKTRGQKELDIQSCTDHIIGLCARLNAGTISSVRESKNIEELKQRVADPIDEFYSLRPEVIDKFAHELAMCMDKIQTEMNQILTEFKKLSPEIPKRINLPFEQTAHIKNGSCKTNHYFSNGLATLKNFVENRSTSNNSQQDRHYLLKCIILLQRLYSTLKLNELFPAKLAWSFLQEELIDFKVIHYDDDTFLDKKNKDSLSALIGRVYGTLQECGKHQASSEKKPILDKLFEIIKGQYEIDPKSRIIIFVTLRKSAKALKDYIGNHEEILKTFGKNKVGYIASTNQAKNIHGQSKSEQTEALRRFANGQYNILIATSVAEEGLDVADCNLVIKYNSVGSEKSFIQRKGRARNLKSRSILLALDYDTEQREYVNMMKAYMMNLCVDQLQKMRESDLKEKISQAQLLMKKKQQEIERKEAEKAQYLNTRYKLQCSQCAKQFCISTNLRFLNKKQVVICQPDCWKQTSIRSRIASKSKRLYDGALGVFCGDWICDCGKQRGEVIKYGDVFLPSVSQDSFKLCDINGATKQLITKVTWDYITSNVFVIPIISIHDIRTMTVALKEYESIYKAVTQNELQNLAEMAKSDHRSYQKNLEID